MSAEDLTCPICGDRLWFTGGVVGISGSGTVECLKGHYRSVHIKRPEPPLVEYVLDDEVAEPDGSPAWLYALAVVVVIVAICLYALNPHTGCAA